MCWAIVPGPADLLSKSPIFAKLELSHREQLAAHLTRLEVAAGADIVRQGDGGDAFYLIESGVVGVFVRDPGLGLVQLVATLEPPESFGEMALVTGERRMATCTAMQPTVVHRLAREVFDAVASQVPNFALGIARTLADRLATLTAEREIPWVSLAGRKLDARLWSIVPEAVFRQHRMVPLELSGRTLTLGMVDPKDLTAVDAVTRAVPGLRAKIAAVSADDYQQLVDTGRGPQARGVASSAAADPQPPLTYVDDDDSRTGPARAAAAGVQSVSPVVALLDDVIGAGLAMGASDIHIEHERKAIQVRYRVDGMLRPRKEPISLDMGKPLVSRVKLLAKLDITDTRKPQDGRISARFGSRLVDLRVSTLRAKLGEKIVMRVLDAEASVTDLKSLIVVEKVRQAFLQMIHRPNGLVMVTGPTGSGKSTTLYGALQARRRPELNIVTVEDPIEYHLDGVTQVQVQPEAGTTFALILRALLRQDPNVILVGEVRDTETARMAIEASMTGHMVLTSVHTNGALEAIARLDDLGVDRHGIANGLVGVVHQRLVRKCCPQCLEPFEYPSLIVDMLYKHGAFLPNERPTLQRGKGCGACAGTGFKGRVGIYEILVANEAVRDAIARGADQVALRQAAAGGAMVELARYAGILVGTGLTIPGEILNLIQRVGGA